MKKHRVTMTVNLKCKARRCYDCAYLMCGGTECALFLDEREDFHVLDHDKGGWTLRLKQCKEAEKKSG